MKVLAEKRNGSCPLIVSLYTSVSPRNPNGKTEVKNATKKKMWTSGAAWRVEKGRKIPVSTWEIRGGQQVPTPTEAGTDKCWGQKTEEKEQLGGKDGQISRISVRFRQEQYCGVSETAAPIVQAWKIFRFSFRGVIFELYLLRIESALAEGCGSVGTT